MTEHPQINNFYETFKKGGKKKKVKRVSKTHLQNINKINIHLGAKGEKEDGLLEMLAGTAFKKKSSVGGGSGMFSAPGTSQGYFRLAEPARPAIAPNLNMAIPNNRVNAISQIHDPSQGSSHNPHNVAPLLPTNTVAQPNLSIYSGSSAFTPIKPEPHRPYSAVASQMTAGRAILPDPSLPRQKPTGRDNYVSPYQGQVDAPREIGRAHV